MFQISQRNYRRRYFLIRKTYAKLGISMHYDIGKRCRYDLFGKYGEERNKEHHGAIFRQMTSKGKVEAGAVAHMYDVELIAILY